MAARRVQSRTARRKPMNCSRRSFACLGTAPAVPKRYAADRNGARLARLL